MTYEVKKQLHFCYGHRLYGYDGPCRHLHGHNATVEIAVATEQLDAQGMAYDFREIKRVVQSWIDEHIDHRMLLQKDDPIVATLQAADEPVYLMDTPPTAENIAQLICEQARAADIPVTKVTVWESASSSATYCHTD
jgi:6-pyruvoyltetrahydropterin/6-carboxytetrahydropterin synthase